MNVQTTGYGTARGPETKLSTAGYVDALIERAQPDEGLPPSVDLTADLPEGTHWPVRDQRHRGTCTAFALTACAELTEARAGDGTIERLSPEYLYWYSRKEAADHPHDRPPDYEQGAVRLSQAIAPLRSRGICRDEMMPYDLTQGLFTETPPTPQADTDAAGHRFDMASWYDYGRKDEEPSGMADILRRELHKGRPVALALKIFYMRRAVLTREHVPGQDVPEPVNLSTTNFTYDGARNSGLIPGPRMQNGVSDDIQGGHVVCVTGYMPGPPELGGSWFIFRNSWRNEFGRYPDVGSDLYPALPGPGYGAVSAAYVEAFTIEYLSLKALAAEGGAAG